MQEEFLGEEFLGEESLGEKYVQEGFLGEESLGEKYVGEKSVGEKSLGENRGRWDAGFRSPLLRYIIHIICTCMHITFLYKLVTESIECSIRQKIIEI